jgi:hypothetical protein
MLKRSDAPQERNGAAQRMSIGRLMRGKDYNAGLRGVLFEARHYERMGTALWLYGWLVLRQTHQQGDIGWVLGGAPISYREIEEETGFNIRTLERWMQGLRREGYIETEAAPAGIIVRIMKAKKFPHAGRNYEGGIRRIAEGVPQNRVPSEPYPTRLHVDTDGIRSSSVALSQDRPTTTDFHRDFHREVQVRTAQGQTADSKSSGLGQTRNRNHSAEPDLPIQPDLQEQKRFFLEARLRQQLLRAERDEAVRRELAVGSGPEVRHS